MKHFIAVSTTFIFLSLHSFAQLIVKVPLGRGFYDAATSVGAFQAFSIEITTKDNPTPEIQTFNNAWRAEFPSVSAGNVKAVEWKLVPTVTLKSPFVLWPPRVSGPLTDSSAVFNLWTPAALRFSYQREIETDIQRKGDIDGANALFILLDEVFDQLSEYNPTDSPGDIHRCSLLQNMISGASAYRSKQVWRNLSAAKRTAWLETEGHWIFKLLSIEEGKADYSSLQATIEAASSWWQLAIIRDLKSSSNWRESTLNGASEQYFVDGQMKQFREELEQVIGYLWSPSVKRVITSEVEKAVGNPKAPAPRKTQLMNWATFTAKGLQEEHLESYEGLFDGLTWLFPVKGARPLAD